MGVWHSLVTILEVLTLPSMTMHMELHGSSCCYWRAKSHIPVHGLPQWPAGVKAIREDDDVILRWGGGRATPHPFSLLLMLFLLVLLWVLFALHGRCLNVICDGIKTTDKCCRQIERAYSISTPRRPRPQNVTPMQILETLLTRL